MQKTNLYILAGFLGSGKTTILNNLLSYFNKQNKKSFVIMNEIGALSIDSDLLPLENTVKDITGGCLCCDNKEQFEYALLSTIQNDKPDNLFIECSGASIPSTVISDCLNPMIADKINFKGIITVVDATQLLNYELLDVKIKNLMFEQWRYADLIIPTKIDLLSDTELWQWTDFLKIWPFRDKILQSNQAKNIITELNKKTTTIDIPASRHHHFHVDTLTFTFSKPISSVKFENWLQNLPEDIFRIKGFLNFSDTPTTKCYLFQYAYGVPITQEYNLKMPYNLVIIGSNLNKEKLLQELEALNN